MELGHAWPFPEINTELQRPAESIPWIFSLILFIAGVWGKDPKLKNEPLSMSMQNNFRGYRDQGIVYVLTN